MTLHWYNLDWPLLYTSKYGGGVTMPKKKERKEKGLHPKVNKKNLSLSLGFQFGSESPILLWQRCGSWNLGEFPTPCIAFCVLCCIVLCSLPPSANEKLWNQPVFGFDIQPPPKCQSCINWKLFLKKINRKTAAFGQHWTLYKLTLVQNKHSSVWEIDWTMVLFTLICSLWIYKYCLLNKFLCLFIWIHFSTLNTLIF